MSHLELSFASGGYDRVDALRTGEVVPEGIKLDFIAIDDSREIFDRMSAQLAFDAAEYSLSELIHRHAAGDRALVAIPVFLSRMFRHGFIAVRSDSGIRHPKDLEGRRIGVPLYTMTAAVFIRGMLQHDYDVDLTGIRWMQGAMNSAGAHGSPVVPPVAGEIDIEYNESGRSLNDLLLAGELDATIGSVLPDALGRDPRVARLFPDYVRREQDYYRRTGIFPIMHTVVIRRDVYERHPFVAPNLFRALSKAKDLAFDRMTDLRTLQYMTPWLTRDIDEIREVFDGDVWPYGVEPNLRTIDALATYMAEQGLISQPVDAAELFVPVHE